MKTNVIKSNIGVGLAIGALAFFTPWATLAFDCYADPEYGRDLVGKIVIDARVRDKACVTGTAVLKTLPAGKIVKIIGETEGWYKIQDIDGTVGWVGARLMALADVSQLTPTSPPAPVKNPAASPGKRAQALKRFTPKSKSLNTSITARVKGYILLGVESRGEAWYLNPSDNRRYYLKDGPAAYEMMRNFGLGVSGTDLVKMQNGDAVLLNRLAGRIVVDVGSHGKAYYVYPKDGTLVYLKDGEAAYQAMRTLGLGISSTDLARIPRGNFFGAGPVTESQTSSVPVHNPLTVNLSPRQKGTVPQGVDLAELNKYWLVLINNLRAEKGLRLLVLDQRWIDTASEWAGYMGENQIMAHTRPDGKTMHQWIDTKGLPFTVRYSPEGWRTNYFTENIAWNQAEGTTDGVKGALDETLKFYLSEASSNGPHYRTIYHPDWNSVGAGFYFEPTSDNRYKIYMAFHYGSLVQ